MSVLNQTANPSRGRLPAYGLQAPLMSNVRQLTPTTSMAGADFQQPMTFPLADQPMVLMHS